MWWRTAALQLAVALLLALREASADGFLPGLDHLDAKALVGSLRGANPDKVVKAIKDAVPQQAAEAALKDKDLGRVAAVLQRGAGHEEVAAALQDRPEHHQEHVGDTLRRVGSSLEHVAEEAPRDEREAEKVLGDSATREITEALGGALPQLFQAAQEHDNLRKAEDLVRKAAPRVAEAIKHTNPKKVEEALKETDPKRIAQVLQAFARWQWLELHWQVSLLVVLAVAVGFLGGLQLLCRLSRPKLRSPALLMHAEINTEVSMSRMWTRQRVSNDAEESAGHTFTQF